MINANCSFIFLINVKSSFEGSKFPPLLQIVHKLSKCQLYPINCASLNVQGLSIQMPKIPILTQIWVDLAKGKGRVGSQLPIPLKAISIPNPRKFRIRSGWPVKISSRVVLTLFDPKHERNEFNYRIYLWIIAQKENNDDQNRCGQQ